jgi:hypothetical protein
MEREITKEEFKRLYFQNAGYGWTEEYWDKFFEHEEGKKYFYREPDSPQATRMFIGSDAQSHRIYFLTIVPAPA